MPHADDPIDRVTRPLQRSQAKQLAIDESSSPGTAVIPSTHTGPFDSRNPVRHSSETDTSRHRRAELQRPRNF